MCDWVIVPLDGCKVAERALPFAMFVTVAESSRLVLAGVADPGTGGELEVYLKDTAATLDVDCETATLSGGKPGARIAEFARERGNALVCMSSHARLPLPQALLGSVTVDVIDGHPGPVAVVGPHASFAGRVENVILPVDGTTESAAVVPLAAAWARRYRAPVHVIEVVAPAALLELAAAGISAGDFRETGYVATIAHGLAQEGIDTTWDVLHDKDPAGAIVRYSSDVPAPVIVMATHGRERLSLATTGSVTGAVMRHARCPVLAIAPRR